MQATGATTVCEDILRRGCWANVLDVDRGSKAKKPFKTAFGSPPLHLKRLGTSKKGPANPVSQNGPANPASKNEPANATSHQNEPNNPGSQNEPDNSASQDGPDNPASLNEPDKSPSHNGPDNPAFGNEPDKSASTNSPDNVQDKNENAKTCAPIIIQDDLWHDTSKLDTFLKDELKMYHRFDDKYEELKYVNDNNSMQYLILIPKLFSGRTFMSASNSAK